MGPSVAFEKLELPALASRRKSWVVADTLVRAIREGHYGPAEKLPAERHLAELLGVGRGAVREALSALQLAGVVQIRTGEGTFVSPVAPLDGGFDRALSILDENESPLDVWEARREIEIALVRLASTKAVADDRRAVEEQLNAMRRHAEEGDYEAYLVANDRFHTALVAGAENSVLKRVALQLVQATHQLMTLDSVQQYLELDVRRSLAKHEAIFEAFVAADAEAIHATIQRHYDDLERHFLDL